MRSSEIGGGASDLTSMRQKRHGVSHSSLRGMSGQRANLVTNDHVVKPQMWRIHRTL
jgi:hypothetical protein